MRRNPTKRPIKETKKRKKQNKQTKLHLHILNQPRRRRQQ
jgi:hypothetical protein